MSDAAGKNLCDDCGTRAINRCPIEPVDPVLTCVEYWSHPSAGEPDIVYHTMQRIRMTLGHLNATRAGESASIHYTQLNELLRALSGAIDVYEPGLIIKSSTDAIVEERGDSYGHPYDHHGKVAAMFGVLTGLQLKAEHIEIMWTLDKLARMSHNDFCDSPTNRDASTDVGGYADKCLKMVWDRRKELAQAAGVA